MKRKMFSFYHYVMHLIFIINRASVDPLSSINNDLKLASDTKSHLGAHSFPVLSVVAFWNWFGSPDVDLGALAGG